MSNERLKYETRSRFASYLTTYQSRVGSSYVEKGFAIILLTIFLAVALYVTAFIFPGALTAIATTALTSVNPGVQTLFQTLIPVVAVVTEVLLYISVVRSVLT